MWCKFWQCRGSICPVLKTDEMTQAVGVGQDGRLYTEPTSGSGISPDAKTAAMTQPVGIDSDGKLWAEPNVTPVSKTSGMTLPVGVDSDGHLFATLPAGSDVKIVKCVPSVVSSIVYFYVPANYKIMSVDLTFESGSTIKNVSLVRYDDNMTAQANNFVERVSGVPVWITQNVGTGNCAMDDSFSLTGYTGVYGVAVCVPN